MNLLPASSRSDSLKLAWPYQKLGKAEAPNDLDEDYQAQVWLPVSNDSLPASQAGILIIKSALYQPRNPRCRHAGSSASEYQKNLTSKSRLIDLFSQAKAFP